MLLLTEVSEAVNHAGIKLIGTRYVVQAMDGYTVLILPEVSDIAIVAFLLQCLTVSFNPALGR